MARDLKLRIVPTIRNLDDVRRELDKLPGDAAPLAQRTARLLIEMALDRDRLIDEDEATLEDARGLFRRLEQQLIDLQAQFGRECQR